MTRSSLVVLFALGVPASAVAQQDGSVRELRFTGAPASRIVCASVLEARRHAETEGRMEFSAELETLGAGATTETVTRIWTGSPHAVGQIDFTGNSQINDTTLRRALLIRERDALDIRRLRRSLARINSLNVFEPLALGDVGVTHLPDTVTVNLTIPLRERKPRSWALSGGILPKAGLRASLSSRFPDWARGALETATYVASIHLSPLTKPMFVIERPLMPGHEWLSGIAISPALSPVGMLTHYARAHIAPAIATVLEPAIDDAVIVRVATADDSSQSLECRPPKPRLWWLRRVALEVMNFAL